VFSFLSSPASPPGSEMEAALGLMQPEEQRADWFMRQRHGNQTSGRCDEDGGKERKGGHDNDDQRKGGHDN